MKRRGKSKNVLNLVLATLLLSGCTFKEETKNSNEGSDFDPSYVSNESSTETGKEPNVDSLSSTGEQPVSESVKYIDYALSDDETCYSVYVKEENKDKIKGNIVIPSSHLGKPITSIMFFAFSNCYSLTSVVIPDSVTTILPTAFMNCSSLKTISIGSNVSECFANFGLPIEVTPFMFSLIAKTYCKNEFENFLDGYINLNFGKKRTFSSSFYGCISLEKMEVSPKNPKFHSHDGSLFQKFSSADDSAFLYNSDAFYGLGKDELSEGDCALIYCPSGKKTIHLPKETTIIYRYAFIESFSIEEIKVSSYNPCFTSKDGFLFSKNEQNLYYYCYSAGKNCVIPNTVKFVEPCALKYLPIESLVIPDSVVSLGFDSFSECTSLIEVTIGKSLNSIGSGSFQGCTSLESITIPANVVTLESSAFNGCCNLKSINGSENVRNIESAAFSDCSSLSSFVFSNFLKTIGDHAFANCASIKEINLPQNSSESIEIGEKAFVGCNSLEEVLIPDTVVSLGDGVFSNCKSLKRAVLGSELSHVGEELFSGCASLKTLTIKYSSGNDFCEHCYADKEESFLETLSFDENCKELTIDRHLKNRLCYYSHLKSITIGPKVEKIDYDFLDTFPALEEINVSSANPKFYSIDGVLYYKEKDGNSLIFYPRKKANKSFSVPNDIRRVIGGAFYKCSFLESLSIPENVTDFGTCLAFECPSLKNVSILGGEKMPYLSDCPKLETVEIGKDVKEIPSDNFYGCDSLISISVSPENEKYFSSDGILYENVQGNIGMIFCSPAKKAILSYLMK